MMGRERWGRGSGILTSARRRGGGGVLPSAADHPDTPDDDGRGRAGAGVPPPPPPRANDDADDGLECDGTTIAGGREDGGYDGSGDGYADDNPFESIGRELDRSEEAGGARRVGIDDRTRRGGVAGSSSSRDDDARAAAAGGGVHRPSANDEDDGGMKFSPGGPSTNGDENCRPRNAAAALPLDPADRGYPDASRECAASDPPPPPPPPTDATTRAGDAKGRERSRGEKDSGSRAEQRSSATAGGPSSVAAARKVSPTRFTFQSSVATVRKAAKSLGGGGGPSSFKTPAPSRDGSLLASRELFSTRSGGSASSARGSSGIPNDKTGRKFRDDDDDVNGSTSRKRRQRRHTFRRLDDGIGATGGAAPAAVNDGNVRELGFAPAFLLAGNSRGGCREVPADDDDDGDDDSGDGKSPRGDASAAFARNMVSDHFRRQLRQQRQQHHRKSSEASNGYLVRRLRSLRDADRRAATGPSGGGGGGGGRYCCATAPASSNPSLPSSSRKRRRGGGFAAGGDRPDPDLAAPSALDVTVSGAPPSLDPALVVVGGGGGGGTVVLLAYAHIRAAAARPSGECEGRRGGGPTLPGFARLVVSRHAMREVGVVGDGRARNLRLYGAVVIPPPRRSAAVAARPERTDADGDGANPDDGQLRMIGGLPTIVCANVCREYPVDQPPLRIVSFAGFSSTGM